MSKITPFLWFDNQAEEAAVLYTSIFKNSRINNVSRTGPDGQVMIVSFELDGQAVTALNGGPLFPFTEAFSFSVDCEDQAEVDYYWQRLLADGGQESQCGWLKDKFGLSWQIVPRALGELMSDPDPVKSQRVMEAMLKMVKLDVAGLQRASAGE
jgi:predicted 3-demethylubiquinone-9 3-methyltransferase (glyoxalase superfamily)